MGYQDDVRKGIQGPQQDRAFKDLNKIELYDLFADLKTYEFEINSKNEEESSTSIITQALVTVEETPAVIAAKSVEQISDDDISLFVKKFGKFMRKNHFNSNSNRNNYKNDYNANLRCFNYDKPSHFKADCRNPKKDDKKPLKKKNKKEYKALLAKESKSKWAEIHSDESSSSESEDEIVKCFMEDNIEVFNFTFNEFTRDDLTTTLNDMIIEYKKL
ncbi:uncharacterized protein LOC124924486 [Impatiens glandulifera]|uniref:uncharacterized protein LOC124924486 n=1 Tax=Impatiens glandulifera TaxID=253017 RepID=UPI001FB08962|nr:uncharacterized protein LOC124924486 [Impatiens glandulifera]